jgi:predicted dehydrogenase
MFYPDITFMPRVQGELRAGFVHEVEHFISAVRNGHAPLVMGHDGAMALKMAEAIIVSAEKHMSVTW